MISRQTGYGTVESVSAAVANKDYDKPYFTMGGHFIVLSKVNSDGTISIKDPSLLYHQDNNSKTFDPQFIAGFGKGYWIISK